MLHERFQPTFESLPAVLPVFPLDNVIIMPGAVLPLNIFEPRYLNMVADAMGSHRMFGMLQPDPSRADQPGAVFRTGCGGRITSYRETADGRIELVLTGLCRFSIREELPGIRGYRLFVGKAGCAGCHSVDPDSALFTDQSMHNTGIGNRPLRPAQIASLPEHRAPVFNE